MKTNGDGFIVSILLVQQNNLLILFDTGYSMLWVDRRPMFEAKHIKPLLQDLGKLLQIWK